MFPYTAFTVVSRIETLVQQPFMSLGAAVSTYTGQNIGAGLKDRVRKGFNSATLVSSIFALAIGVVFWIFATVQEMLCFHCLRELLSV